MRSALRAPQGTAFLRGDDPRHLIRARRPILRKRSASRSRAIAAWCGVCYAAAIVAAAVAAEDHLLAMLGGALFGVAMIGATSGWRPSRRQDEPTPRDASPDVPLEASEPPTVPLEVLERLRAYSQLPIPRQTRGERRTEAET